MLQMGSSIGEKLREIAYQNSRSVKGNFALN